MGLAGREAQSEALSDAMQQAEILNAIGFVESSLGKEGDALKDYRKVLGLIPRLDPGAEARCVEANARNGMGVAWERLGQEEKALASFRAALALENTASGPDAGANRADTLNRIGVVYSDLGQKKKALELFLRALPQYPAEETEGKAITLNNVGWTRSELGDQAAALRDLENAYAMQVRLDDTLGQAYTLDSIGMVRSRLHETDSALTAYRQSVKKAEKAEDRFVEAHALWETGEIDFGKGDLAGAIENHLAALDLATAIRNPGLEGDIQGSLMRDYSGRNTDAAIFFGINAVNAYQQIRRGIAGMESGVQVGFAQLKSPVYRELAELLTQRSELARAEEVLDLLQEEELREVVRGGSEPAEAKTKPLPLTGAQQAAAGAMPAAEAKAATLVGINLEYATLVRQRTPEDDPRLVKLRQQIEAGNREVSELLDQLMAEELKPAGAKMASELGIDERNTVSGLQIALQRLGPGVLGIRLVLGDEHVYALVVTANARKRVELPVQPAVLRDQAGKTWNALRHLDPGAQSLLGTLYGEVVAPLEDELKALEATAPAGGGAAPTVLWSLDGVLRYIPMAALYDGQHYLVERFNNVLVTPASYTDLKRGAALGGVKPETLAMGLAKSYGGLPALCGVMPELEAVVRDTRVTESHGALQGRLLADDKVTLAALEQELSDESKPHIVHIASHFVFAPPDGSEPYLLLAGEDRAGPQGYAWSLSGIEDSAISFEGTKLLTLSACSTATDAATGDGRELESPGMIAQQKGAEAVLGTLWDVADTSTSMLMSDFYARWIGHPQEGKAEALRQAQIDLLKGRSRPEKAGGSQCRADGAAPGTSAGDYSHPYYWAPFVLMGNYE